MANLGASVVEVGGRRAGVGAEAGDEAGASFSSPTPELLGVEFDGTPIGAAGSECSTFTLGSLWISFVGVELVRSPAVTLASFSSEAVALVVASVVASVVTPGLSVLNWKPASSLISSVVPDTLAGSVVREVRFCLLLCDDLEDSDDPVEEFPGLPVPPASLEAGA